MKYLTGVFLLIVIFAINSKAQDTLYIYQSGEVVVKRAVSDIDSIIFYQPAIPETITDIEGNIYIVVTIGTQKWMAENLATTHLNDGTEIPSIINSTFPSYLYYNDDSVANAATYGVLYNWPAANSGNLCPSGWHVPTDAEWTVLTNYLGGLTVAGGKMKETGTAHWNSPNAGATNESGFSARPGGRFATGFANMGVEGNWWSSTEDSSSTAWMRLITSFMDDVSRSSNNKVFFLSVRCIED
ncbi:MAG: hypothetical protein A2W91_02140 [Bacteroidetes bacterium GWF2_38_335]|nr:MAG: hypothetical protein A2W91_02140 [Bacteroidetes bacterium GWF2_38_335]OFY80653.1 MAG: hypothetical protein A2281_05155 [Bacteroidetes bacterium RIFOXYA12_FULL_38_20]HBS86994.1 hypothetical protein [Bacteroidales bacterium]